MATLPVIDYHIPTVYKLENHNPYLSKFILTYVFNILGWIIQILNY